MEELLEMSESQRRGDEMDSLSGGDQDGSPGNPEQERSIETNEEQENFIEVREEVVESEVREQRAYLNTGQSFGEIVPRQSTNRDSAAFQGETF